MKNLSRKTVLILLPILTTALILSVGGVSFGQTIILYQNDFETPNVSVVQRCGYALDSNTINALYGGAQGTFAQVNTVEAVLITEGTLCCGATHAYVDSSGTGGNYAIGMLSAVQNDKLSLTFDSQGKEFINVGMDISSIDVAGCGGPFGVAAPIYRISLLDSPGGVFNWSNTVLDQVDITGPVGADAFTFNWTNSVAALDTSGSTDGNVSIVWDLIQSGYAAFDNLIIAASDDPGDIGEDTDDDGVVDSEDNCPDDPNPGQENNDGDELGNVCDPDDDNDGVDDGDDNCPVDANAGQENNDGDAQGDVCDPDDDNDGVDDGDDNCPLDANPGQENNDGDAQGDVCDSDDDNDGVGDGDDNCPLDANPGQEDIDGDGLGDVCDPSDDRDTDGDGVLDVDDNCPGDANPGQENNDGDGMGDVCDPDDDNDGVDDGDDNCPLDANPGQQNNDGDGMGDVCDPDDDNDGVDDGDDNCPLDANPGQENGDGDELGDACDPDTVLDSDSDGINDDVDLCAETVIPESVPMIRLRPNRFALTDGDGMFDSTHPNDKHPRKSFSLEDTGGCSCEQIIEALGLGKGHSKWGCSSGAIEEWIELINQ